MVDPGIQNQVLPGRLFYSLNRNHFYQFFLYHARNKLSVIKKSQQNQVSTDELIRYSYLIANAGTVAAPVKWQPGDARRPFPTELQMRESILHKFSAPASEEKKVEETKPAQVQAGSLAETVPMARNWPKLVLEVPEDQDKEEAAVLEEDDKSDSGSSFGWE